MDAKGKSTDTMTLDVPVVLDDDRNPEEFPLSFHHFVRRRS
jgi:hypothetical protein